MNNIKTFLAELVKDNFNSPSSRSNVEYPIKVIMADRYQATCASQDLKNKKQYFVEKCKSTDSRYDFDFGAYIKKGFCGRKKGLSILRAERGGFCWATPDLSPPPVQGCGLATALMEICFEDKDVGSIDPLEDYNFKLKGLEKWQQMALLNCENIKYTSCNPAPPTPTVGCAAYMSAAINTGHKMMFTFPNENAEMSVLNIENEARPRFKEDADTFEEEHGNFWYFCRCKEDRKTECENM